MAAIGLIHSFLIAIGAALVLWSIRSLRTIAPARWVRLPDRRPSPPKRLSRVRTHEGSGPSPPPRTLELQRHERQLAEDILAADKRGLGALEASDLDVLLG